VADIATNLAQVHARIDAACRRAGRDRGEVQLVAVTKQRSLGQVLELLRLGEKHFGENRAQEVRDVVPLVPEGPTWHFIGRLQSNKAKYLPGLVTWIHSVDSLALAEALSKAYSNAGATAKILLQVNISGEAAKAGSDAGGARALLDSVVELRGLQIEGLMTMAPYSEDPELARPVFRGLRELRDRLVRESGVALLHLSMGMSGDYEVAIEEGATLVRVGSALFE